MVNSLAIPANKLGHLESVVRALPSFNLTRDRKAEFSRIVRVLKDLKLIAKESEPVAVSIGCDKAGALLLIVNFAIDQRINIPLSEGE